MRTKVEGYNSTRVKLLRQREEPPEAIPEEGGRGVRARCFALLMEREDQKIPAPFLWEGEEMGWKGRRHPGFTVILKRCLQKGCQCCL